MNKEIRVVLSANDFASLVEGHEVLWKTRDPKTPAVRIILSDIGFGTMHHLVEKAEGTH